MLSDSERAEMASALRVRPNNPDFICAVNTLEMDGQFDGVSRRTIDKWKEAIVEVREEMRAQKQARESALQRTATLTPPEGARGQALDRERAKRAAGESKVKQFRERVLQDGLLDELEAIAFIESPALAILSQQQCTDAGIPLIGHVAAYTDMNRRPMPPTWDTTLTVSPPSRTIHVRPRIPERPVHLRYPRDGWAHTVAVWKSSVLGELWDVSEYLTEQYGWKRGNAPLFVLTDLIPSTSPMTTQWHSDTNKGDTITLEIAAWVSAKTVERVYKAVQDEIYETVPGVMSERNLAVFDFVTKHRDVDGDIPPWDTLIDMWNSEHEGHGWRYPPHMRKYFERDYERAVDALFRPKYRNGDPVRNAWTQLTEPGKGLSPDSHVDSQREP